MDLIWMQNCAYLASNNSKKEKVFLPHAVDPRFPTTLKNQSNAVTNEGWPSIQPFRTLYCLYKYWCFFSYSNTNLHFCTITFRLSLDTSFTCWKQTLCTFAKWSLVTELPNSKRLQILALQQGQTIMSACCSAYCSGVGYYNAENKALKSMVPNY